MPAATYRQAGVDIAAADRWLAGLAPLVRSTYRSGVLPDRGQFAGLFRLPAREFRDPVLVSSTDGVGTKLALAPLAGDHTAIGVDVVAMNTNDVLAYGAQPLFFLDYIAVGRLNPPVMTQLLRGIAQGCRASGCALLGGETAEMPGCYEDGAYDVAGFCVGVVERRRLLDGVLVRAGDAIKPGVGSALGELLRILSQAAALGEDFPSRFNDANTRVNEALLGLGLHLRIDMQPALQAKPDGSRLQDRSMVAMLGRIDRTDTFDVAFEKAPGLPKGPSLARELLAPLVLQTTANWAERGGEALTGPIARGDEETVERHLEAIGEAAPELLDVYRTLAARTREIAARRTPEVAA